MLILGINDSHDASACLVKDGKLLVALSEERKQRIKGMGGFPQNAIKTCFSESGLKFSDVDRVALATKRIVPTNMHHISHSFSIEDYHTLQEKYYYPLIYRGEKIKLNDIFPNFKAKGETAYPLDKIPFITTSEIEGSEMEEIIELRKKYTAEFIGIDSEKVKFINHHRSHSFHGYYTSPYRSKEKVLIITSDSGGDNTYTSVNVVKNGEFSLIHEAHNSLIGKFYSSVTLLLGMRPNEHEYKVMGLAPYASEYQKKVPREIFLNALSVDGMDFVKNPEMKDFYFYFKDKLKLCRFDGIAGGLQDFVELRLVEWFQNIIESTQIKDVVYGGGVANNVKANKKICEQDFVNSMFVPAGPSDEGLSIGAAFCVLYDEVGHQKANELIESPKNAYFGNSVNSDNHLSFKKHPFTKKNYEIKEHYPISEIAKIISKGGIVAICQGRMEFGSRSLGHRSLVADPSNLQSARKLNDLIKKRDFWMPFTPSILDRCFQEYVINPKNIPSSFMTNSFDTTPLGKEHLKGAVHPYDYTVRPQKVTSGSCPKYYELIEAFQKLTNIGALLNTSLNIHGKPIVMDPTDLLNEILIDGQIPIDYILIEDTFYIRKKENL
jgi:carbamoyltransferase